IQNLYLSPGLRNLLFGGLRKFMRLNGDCGVQLAVTENLHAAIRADDSRLAQNIRIYRILAERRQLLQVHDVVFLAEDVSEATLGQAGMQRHLSAFEAAHHARTAAGTLALVAAG